MLDLYRGDYQKAFVDSVVNRAVKSGDSRIRRVHMPPLSPSDLGCDYHPNAAGQQKYADVLIPVVRQYLGTTGTCKPSRRSRAEPGRKGLPETGMRPLRGGDPTHSMNTEENPVWVDARGRSLEFEGFSGNAVR